MSASYDITIEQGTDWTRELFLTTATQGAIDLTGRTFTAPPLRVATQVTISLERTAPVFA